MQRGFIQIPILIAVIFGVFAVGGAGYVGVKQYQSYQEKKVEEEKIEQAKESEAQARTEAQQEALEKAQLEIQKLKEETETAKQKQSVLEQEIQANKRNEQKEQQVLPQGEETEMSKAEIVKSWQNSVLKISCTMINPYTEDSFLQSGSGYGFKLSDDRIFLFTNKHVLLNNEAPNIKECTASVPGVSSFKIDLQTIGFHNKLDFARMASDNSGKNFTMPYTFNFCPANTAQLGDEILILGYPVTGSQTSITVTDGIISGFEEDYFVTSAKIEQGNSGGVAILLKQNCFLGLPTDSAVGAIESLGRILKIEKIIDYKILEKLR